MASNRGTSVTVSNVTIEGQRLVQVILKLNLEGEEVIFKLVLDDHVSLSESIEMFKGKIQKVLSKIYKKKRRVVRKHDNPPPLPDKPKVAMQVYTQDEEIDPKLPGNKGWQTAMSVKLCIGDDTSNIDVLGNPPQVKMLKLGDCLMTGYPIYPRIETLLCNLSSCSFKWYRSHNGDENAEDANSTWELISENIIYTPAQSDIGAHLKVVCIPSDGDRTGDSLSFISKQRVVEGPMDVLCMKRDVHTHVDSKDSFRIISYNTLASYYAVTESSTEWLYPYCPEKALALDYRIKLIFKEIQGYNADIIALQEIDQKAFEFYLNPLMEAAGFEGCIKMKRRTVSQGIVIFTRKSKFKCIDTHGIKTPDMLTQDPMYQDLFDLTATNQDFHLKILTAKCALQVVALESVENPKEMVLVGNTHLTSQIRGSNVRLVQMLVILRHLQHIKDLYEKQGYSTSVVLCGDMNSLPTSGLVQLLEEGKLPSNHADWYTGGKMELMAPYEASHSFNFHSACGYPKYTNYVTGFQGCIDYIFIEKEKLKETYRIPMPNHADVVKHTALPNAEFPSDHLAIGCDLTWCN